MDLVYWSFENLPNIRKYQKLKMIYFAFFTTEFAGTSEKLKVHDLKYISSKFATFITICTIPLYFGL